MYLSAPALFYPISTLFERELKGQLISYFHDIRLDGGFGFGPCEMPNTMLVDDTSGDGSGSTSLMTRAEMPGPCICEGGSGINLYMNEKFL